MYIYTYLYRYTNIHCIYSNKVIPYIPNRMKPVQTDPAAKSGADAARRGLGAGRAEELPPRAEEEGAAEEGPGYLLTNSEYGTSKAVKARFWPWFSIRIPHFFTTCSLYARTRQVED